MPRITPVNWKALVKVFEADGFVYERTNGDHMAYVKAGVVRPIIIPKHREIGPHVIRSNMRTAGMSRKRYFELLGG